MVDPEPTSTGASSGDGVPSKEVGATEGSVSSGRGTNVRIQPSGSMRRATLGAVGLFVLTILTFVAGAFLGFAGALESFLGWMLLVSPLLALLGAIIGQFRFKAGESLGVENGQLTLTKRRRNQQIPTLDLREGWLSPREKRVYFQTWRGDTYSASVENDATGQALLVQTGLDASKRTLRMRLGPTDFLTAMGLLVGPIFAFPIGALMALLLGLHGIFIFPLALVLYVAQFYLVRKIWGPAHLVLGADGIIVKSAWKTRFVSFRALRSISTGTDHVTLHLHDGSTVRAHARHLDSTIRETIQLRVDEALMLSGGISAAPGALAQLDKGTQSKEGWRAALSAILQKDGGYRGARLTREQLLDVLENPGANVQRRIGAALALSSEPDPETAVRIRIAAGASANEKVRVALEKIAGGDTEAEAVDEAVEMEESYPPKVASSLAP